MSTQATMTGCLCGSCSTLRGARWYKRLQARILSAENARYTASVEPWKRSLFGVLQGDVVEIGPGGGVNLRYLSPAARWTGVEPNPFMHDGIQERAEALGVVAQVRLGVAERLPFADASVDAVMSSLVLCSVESQEQTLREVLRVLKPGGHFAFVEHVADPVEGRRARMQRFLSPLWNVIADGCHTDRRTWEAIQAAGFSTVRLTHFTAPVPLMGPHVAGLATK